MTVNVENINKVIDLIREEKMAKFDMQSYKAYEPNHPCRTAGCIAGFAAIASSGEPLKHIPMNSIKKLARDYLGLDYDTSDDLFKGRDGKYRVPLSKFRKRDAIRVLEHLRDTGKVDVSMIPGAIPHSNNFSI